MAGVMPNCGNPHPNRHTSRRPHSGNVPRSLQRKMTKVLLAVFTTDYADLTDFTERIDRNFIHLFSEQLILSNLFKIRLICEISGYHLPL
jgi:hypothetical protein